MARKRGRKDRSDAISQPQSLAVLLRPSPVQLPVSVTPLREVEDRREYHPVKFHRPARDVSGQGHKPVVVKPSRKFGRVLPFGLRFAEPARTVLCVRRKTRKEVLHAIRKTGKGVRRRKPRRNWFSRISCT